MTDNDWSLTPSQIDFFTRFSSDIENAFECDDMDRLAMIANSPEFLALFTSMSLDEAIDRYEEYMENMS